MTTRTREKHDVEAEKIKALLNKRFKNASAYRYNSVSIRVRVIDKGFKGLSRIERENLVMPLLRALEQITLDDITLLLLLTPEEAETSMMNLEFDDPSRSGL